MHGISDYLNQHGYTKKRVRDQEVSHFTRSFLMRVLDNPVYTGKIDYGKSATEKVKGSRDDRNCLQAAYEKQITGKNVNQFLLDFDTFFEVAQRVGAIVLGQIVVDEVCNKFKENLVEQVTKVNNSLRVKKSI